MERLATILADMLRSALTWEEVHGQHHLGDVTSVLTGIPHRGVYSGGTGKYRGGDSDGDQKDYKKNKPHNNFRRS